ncbi:zinc ribbon domain-containing protein [Mycetohabitans sp. B46]|uniref:zinc ribbon domain-containing protein n=1 Tax=Mycetohabitans sp. B46 TaxID=2772536 RepID=UPI003FD3CD11
MKWGGGGRVEQSSAVCRTEQVHLRPRLIRVSLPAGQQAGVGRRLSDRRAAQNTSRTCPACRHVSADNRQRQAQFRCVACGFEENADLVGAINLLRVGHARCACEVNGEVMPPAAGTPRSDSFPRHLVVHRRHVTGGDVGPFAEKEFFRLL